MKIIIGKPPAMRVNSQSLTLPGVRRFLRRLLLIFNEIRQRYMGYLIDSPVVIALAILVIGWKASTHVDHNTGAPGTASH